MGRGEGGVPLVERGSRIYTYLIRLRKGRDSYVIGSLHNIPIMLEWMEKGD